MLQIGQLRIKGKGVRPRSRQYFKQDARELARTLGLRLYFTRRPAGIDGTSYCYAHQAKAVVCEGTGSVLFPLREVIETTLHEIAHWIQYNEGMFKGYFGTGYYGGTIQDLPSIKKIRQLELRAERHADWLSDKLLFELYGLKRKYLSVYDSDVLARELRDQNYQERLKALNGEK